jgi:YgiT-type zinc finger domain-containing protein
MTEPFDKCPACGGELAEKEVEKLLQGGGSTATVRVRAEVCLHCGERLYSRQTILRFEDIRRKLQRRQTEGFRVSGQAFEVVS